MADVDRFTQSDLPGPPGLVPAGAWSPDANYVERQVVRHAGSAWVALLPSIGVEPSMLSDRWSLFVESGQDGKTAYQPVFALERIGDDAFLSVVDWVPATDTPPSSGYLGPGGTIVGSTAGAVNLRGPAGSVGPAGPSGFSVLRNVGGASSIAYRTEAIPPLGEGGLQPNTIFIWRCPTTNSGSVTMDIDNTGPRNLLTTTAVQAPSGNFLGDNIYLLLYDGAQLIQVTQNNLGPLADTAAAAVAQATTAIATLNNLNNNLVALLASKADTIHTHLIADVLGLTAALEARSLVGHTHALADIVGLVGALAGKATVVHTHVISGVVGLQDALDSKALASHTHPISQVVGLQANLDTRDTNLTAAINTKADAAATSAALAQRATLAQLALKANDAAVQTSLDDLSLRLANRASLVGDNNFAGYALANWSWDVNTYTASRTLDDGDKTTVARFNSNSAIVVTLPANWAPGLTVRVLRAGPGPVSWALAAGATLGLPTSKNTHTGVAEQWGEIEFMVDSNSDGNSAHWVVRGATG